MTFTKRFEYKRSENSDDISVRKMTEVGLYSTHIKYIRTSAQSNP